MTPSQVVQRVFERDQALGYPGDVARENAPTAFDTGQIYVASNAIDPRPGEPVIYDATRNQYRLPASASENDDVLGIISFDSGTVASNLDSFPAGANSPSLIEYADDATVKVGVLGTFWALAGEALEYGDIVEWDWNASNTSSYRKWTVADGPTAGAAALEIDSSTLPSDYTSNATANAAVKATVDAALTTLHSRLQNLVAGFRRVPIICVSPSPVAADGIAELRVGWALR